MLELKFIRENPDVVRAAIAKKRMTVDLDRFLKVEEECRLKEADWQSIKAEQNATSKTIGQLSPEERPQVLEQVKVLKDKLKDLDKEIPALKEERDALAAQMPSIPADEVPEGEDDTENVLLRTWYGSWEGKTKEENGIPYHDYNVIDHVTYGLDNDLMDFERASKIAGSRTYFLKNQGALLDLAIQRMAIDLAQERGFAPVIAPMIVRHEAMYGTGYFPGGEDQSYAMERDEAFLIGTSEVPLTSYHGGEILNEDELPKKYAGISSCFRREAGAAGKDTRGLYRIHQFNKIEQVIVCKADAQISIEHHNEILANSEEMMKRLELPYRVVNVCGGDLGQGQIQKYDIEAWMPSRDSWGETHSASRFHDFQARRLKLQYRDKEGKTHYCHTLNNTLIATPRVLIPMLEVHQQEDGRVRIPDALRPYTGFDFIEPLNKTNSAS